MHHQDNTHRLRCAALLVAMGIAAACAGAATASRAAQVPIAPEPVLEDRFPTQVASFPEGVVAHANLVYSTLPGYRPLTLDLYAQAPGARPRPLVVYIHGGGWRMGHSRQSGAFADFPGVLAALAARGYVVASVNYRLSGEARFPAALQDVQRAIRWLRAHAADYGIDPTRVLAWGGSAGGQLAGLAATRCVQPELAPPAGEDPQDAALAAQPACVQGAVLWYGVFDFARLPGATRADGAEARYLGCAPADCPGLARLASSTPAVGAATPPLLLVVGSDDAVVPPEQSRTLHAAMLAAGRDSQLLEIPGVGHSFVGKDAEATAAASRRALDATFAFFARVAPPAP